MFRHAALLLFGLLGLPAQGVPGQEPLAPLRLEVAGESGEVRVYVGDILADPSLQEAVRSGLPLRVEVVTQLWSDGFFDGQVGQVRWRASVVHDPLDDVYLLVLGDGGPAADRPTPERRAFPTLDELRAAFPRILQPSLRPAEEGRFYYLARISVETLSLSDLQELQRWLRGELAPAISGDGDVENAVERGLRRTLIRLLGMPTRRFDTRTRSFTFEGS